MSGDMPTRKEQDAAADKLVHGWKPTREEYAEHDANRIAEIRARADLVSTLSAKVEKQRRALVAISDMLMGRPDMVKALTPLMGPAEHAVFEQARAALTPNVGGEG